MTPLHRTDTRWFEAALDSRRGRLVLTQVTEQTVSVEFGILGGVMGDELFAPTPRTRLAIHCQRSGEITLRILEGRSSGV